MKKFFIYLLITMTGLAAQNAWAQGVLLDGGSELDDATTKNYLEEFCGLTSTTDSDGNTTWSFAKDSKDNYVAPKGAKDVFFVEVNDYWKGLNSGYDFYTQISRGVKKISTVNTDSKQTTSSGTFYTHQATDVNKFFFIVRRDSSSPKSTAISNNLAFGWYDEWSYVTETSVSGAAGWDALQPTWNTLMDGTPFPSPHNCDTSLETNHYIALDGKNPADSEGHDFTAYLYIPSGINVDNLDDKTKTETVNVEGEYEYKSNGKTYYIYDVAEFTYTSWLFGTETVKNTPVSNLGEDIYCQNEAGEYVKITELYAGKYYNTRNYDRYSDVTAKVKATVKGYTLQQKTTTVSYRVIPYVLFYAVGLNDVTDEALENNKKANYDATQNPYNVPLNWTTAFDKFANHEVQYKTQYDGMQEHYIVERSYDKSDWVVVTDEIRVVGDNVRKAAGKTTVDEGLKPFDKVTEEIGYTVWYRVTSIVEKTDGVPMSTTTSNVIRVDIPGKVPFKLTLDGEGTMTYDPVAQTNTFTNTIISAESKVTEKITLVNGSILGLYQVDTKGNQIKLLKDAKVSEVGENNDLQELAKLIDNVTKEGELKGKYNHSMTLPAGDENVAAYQLMMTMPTTGGEVYKFSNILTITNPAISNTTVAVHRSGTPDAATCALQETFHNEIKFKASTKQTGSGYYIYRDKNATPIMKLNYTERGFRVDGTDTYYVPDADGYISVVDIKEAAPIAVGETGSATNNNTGAWSYAVAHYDAKGNTYGSKAIATPYNGARGELLLSVEANMKAANFSQPGNYNIYTVVTITWSNRLAIADTQPSKFEIYVKKKGTDMATAPAESAAAPVDMEAGFVKIPADVTADTDSYTFTDTYLSKWQSENNQKYNLNDATSKELFAKSLEGAYEIYVKMTTTEGKEKNSFIAIPEPQAGAIYTGIEGVEAQEMDVKVVNGVVEVNGVYGMIKVIDATGAVAAEAVGTGDVTEIEGLGTGVYVVTAKDMKPTKILIK